MRFRWSTEVEDLAGRRVRGLRALLHGRAWLHLGDEDRPHSSITLEWNLRSRSFGASAEVTDDCEDALNVMAAFPPVALYAGLDASWLAALVQRLTGTRYGWQREVSVRVHDWGVHWRAWADPHHWSSSTPRWRDGSWYPFGFPGRKVSSEVVEEREVDVPFPGGVFRARAKRELVRRKSTTIPFATEELSVVTLDFEHLPAKPEGRKGGIWSSSCEARTIDAAIGKFVGDEIAYNRAPVSAAAE